MSRLIVVEPAKHMDGASTARVRVGRRTSEISFRVRGVEPLALDDPFVPLAVLMGMRRRAPVRIEGPVTSALLASLEGVEANLLAWYPSFRRVPVDARAPVDAPSRTGRGIACFFSAGLDSFYSVLRPPGDVTHFLFVHGFDLRLADTALRERVAVRVRAAAASLGARLVEVETDLRQWSDPLADWTWFCHAGLVGVGLLVGRAFDEVRIAATIADVHRPSALRGAAPRTWDNGLARIVSTGGDATRPQKARVVATSEVARAALRVCWKNRGGRYNCGGCAKCLRTMVALEVAGVRHAFPDFAGTLDLAAVAALPTRRRSDRQLLDECLWETKGRSDSGPVAESIRAALRAGEPRGVRRWLAAARDRWRNRRADAFG